MAQDLTEVKKAAADREAERNEAQIDADAASKSAELADAAAAAAEGRKGDAEGSLTKVEQDLQTAIVAVAQAKAAVTKAEADQVAAEGVRENALSQVASTTEALSKASVEALAVRKDGAACQAELAKRQIDFGVAGQAVTDLEASLAASAAPAEEASAEAAEEG